MIYLASPYSGTAEQMQSRYEQALAFTQQQLLLGKPIFSPIVYGHQFASAVGTSATDWLAFNKHMLQLAESLWVLRLPGWESSIGIKAEIAFWNTLGKSAVKQVIL